MKRKRTEPEKFDEGLSPDTTTQVVGGLDAGDGNPKGYVDALTPGLTQALNEIRDREAAQDKEKKPAGPAPAKKARSTAMSGAPAKPPLTRVPSILTAKEHELPAMAVVKLRPAIELENDRIADVVISTEHRTPSPYGARMGDHTVAWQVIVDSLRALLFGLTLEEAVSALRVHHLKVSVWMQDKNSTAKKLLLMLRHPVPERSAEERMDRVRRLEDAAYQADRHLAEAARLLGALPKATAPPPSVLGADVIGDAPADPRDKGREQLEFAIGQHLAFVNYLPFATVRSTKARGSVGSSEGHYRKIVMRVEAPNVPASVDVEIDDEPEEAEAAEEILAEGTDAVEPPTDTPTITAPQGGAPATTVGGAKAGTGAMKVPASGAPETMDTEEEEPEKKAEEKTAPNPVVPPNPKVVREALWKLFSFEAALRAADTNLALRPPGSGKKVSDLHARLIARAEQAEKDLRLYIPGRGKEPPTQLDLTLVTKLRDEAEADAELLLKRKEAEGLSSDDPLWGMAKVTYDIANWILGKQPRQAKERERLIKKLYGEFAAASVAKTDVVKQEKTAIDDAASILAYLIHDHQSSVAAAYPIAVGKSFFLSPEPPLPVVTPDPGVGSGSLPGKAVPVTTTGAKAASKTTPVQVPKADPAATAVQRLKAEIERSPNLTLTAPTDRNEQSPLDKLLTAFDKAYKALRNTPAAGEPNGWAAHRKTRHLVVAHDPTQRALGLPTITLNGRAAAPRGVAGMGSHTTAWVVEVAATDALASVPDDVLNNFAKAVETDLGSDVMRLDVYLPVAQLVGGQLEQLLDAAVRVRRAKTVGAAATAYLSFRNLLPFATVDAGSRGGHGEDLTAPMDKLFDLGSLEEAAELQAEALKEFDTREQAIKALANTGANLIKMSKRAWMKDTVVEPAMLACAARLKAHSEALTAGAPAAEVNQIILTTRWLSHKVAYADAATSRKMLNAFETAHLSAPAADYLAWLRNPALPRPATADPHR